MTSKINIKSYEENRLNVKTATLCWCCSLKLALLLLMLLPSSSQIIKEITIHITAKTKEQQQNFHSGQTQKQFLELIKKKLSSVKTGFYEAGPGPVAVHS